MTREDSVTDRAALRRAVYLLLIVVAVATMVSRIMTVRSTSGRTPFLSANDRSRWSTVRALVDHGTFELDDVIFPNGKRDRDWYSIDLVRHRGRDGREHYYSSKPPLLTTLLAAEYWCIRSLTGATLDRQPMYVGRIMLVISNVIPMAVLLVLLARLIEQHGRSDWGRIVVMVAACFGTMLTTIAVTITNHLPGAFGCALAATALFPILQAPRTCPASRWWFLLAGLGAGFLVANELPALSLAVFALGIIAPHARLTHLACYAAPIAALLGLLLVLNYLAHESWRPAYAHRGDGPIRAQLTLPGNELREGLVSNQLRQALLEKQLPVSADATMKTSTDSRWMLWDESSQTRLSLRADNDNVVVHEWDDWYRYEGSYWVPENLQGVDRGEPNVGTYLFQVVIGHHGILSLTPIWFFAIAGAWLWHRRNQGSEKWIARLTVVTTLVCLGFYTFGRPTIDRNYGGVSCGFRWMYWFIPLWLLLMLPAMDAIAMNPEGPVNSDCDQLNADSRRRTMWKWARGITLCLLAWSIFSASYPTANP
ncbi:MAG: hypothetical protein RIS70_209, partial [Planctomycetota bacterium]